MALYRLCLLSAAGAAGPKGNVIAVQRLHADTDEEGLAVARETVKGNANVSGYEVWEGARGDTYMTAALTALLGVILGAILSGVLLESYKRHRDRQGTASALAGELFSILQMSHRRNYAATFTHFATELDAGRPIGGATAP